MNLITDLADIWVTNTTTTYTWHEQEREAEVQIQWFLQGKTSGFFCDLTVTEYGKRYPPTRYLPAETETCITYHDYTTHKVQQVVTWLKTHGLDIEKGQQNGH